MLDIIQRQYLVQNGTKSAGITLFSAKLDKPRSKLNEKLSRKKFKAPITDKMKNYCASLRKKDTYFAAKILNLQLRYLIFEMPFIYIGKRNAFHAPLI